MMNAKRITIAALAAAMLLLAGQAQAGSFHYTKNWCPPQEEKPQSDCNLWEVDFTVKYKVSYNNYKTYNGSICFDDSNLNGSGKEYLGVAGGNKKAGLLSLNFDFKGSSLTEKDDKDFPNYPIIKFYNGVFKGLDFMFKLSGNKYHIEYGDFEKNNCDKGWVKYDTPTEKCTVVPTPAAVSGGLALLASLGFKRRRHAA